MGVYEALGVRPIINAAGTLTRVGGTRMSPEVLAAMDEAAASFVHIDELQARGRQGDRRDHRRGSGLCHDRRGGGADAWHGRDSGRAWMSARWTACPTPPA